MRTIPTNLDALIKKSFPQALADLEELVRIPSVSWPSFDQSHVAASAEAVKRLATHTGVFDSVEILHAQTNVGTAGNPAVVATKKAGHGWPTVLLYAHHDVQPPGDVRLWETDPFTPTVIGERLYGRGTADDKAGLIVHLTSVSLLRELLPSHELGLVLFVEGEEEYGSPSFMNFLNDHKQKLSADVIVVADSGNWDTETPALTSSLRGNVTFNLQLSTLDHALHSGMFGGAAPDAFLAFAQLVSSFYNPDGTIAIGGLTSLDETTPDYSEERFREESGLLPGVSVIGGGNVAHSLWLEPSVTVTGVDFPTVSDASNTLLPTVKAKISVRIAPHQDAQDAYTQIEQHIRQHAPFGAHIEITDVNIGQGYHVKTDGSSFNAYSQALEEIWGVRPVNMGVGGSIPFISDFVDTFPHAEVLVTGVEDPDSRAHSPNESLHIPSFQKGIAAETLFLLWQCNF